MSTEAAGYPASPEALRQALQPESAADVVLIASQFLRLGSLDYAEAVCVAWQGAPEPAIALTRAAARFGRGEQESAIALVDEVLRARPEHVAALFYRAQMAEHVGDRERALTLLLAVLDRCADFPGAHTALATLCLPGRPYREVLRRLHELLEPHTYLEIGVETGATLALAKAAERSIGIDPDASALRRELLPPNARVFHQTSDAFFAERQRAELLGSRRVQLAFIDGMHLFEYALRDFIHAESWSEPGGSIVLHDCLAVHPLSASRERRTKFWVGDVWKLVPILQELRSDLSIKLIATAPSGLCVVRRLDPSSTVLQERFDEIVERYRELPYPAPAGELPRSFECVPATEAGVRQALS